jgi:tetratricopeptide (TPR) repeat protein
VYKSEGRMNEALDCFQKDLEISKSLHEGYPEYVDYKNHLGIAYSKLGEVYKSEGRMNLALDCFLKDLEIQKSLHESYPEQVDYQFGYGVSLIYSGLVIEKMGQNANEYFQKAYEVYQNLLQKVPNNAKAQQNLNWLKRKLGK